MPFALGEIYSNKSPSFDCPFVLVRGGSNRFRVLKRVPSVAIELLDSHGRCKYS